MKLNDQKITKDFCKGKTLIFCSKTEEEATFIYQKIVELGFVAHGTSLADPARCVALGIVLKNAEVRYFDPEKDSGGLVCTSSQFDENYLSPEIAFIMAQFNRLAAKVDAIYEELRPAKLDKPVFKKPDSTPEP